VSSYHSSFNCRANVFYKNLSRFLVPVPGHLFTDQRRTNEL
jgi:hypothetical protein